MRTRTFLVGGLLLVALGGRGATAQEAPSPTLSPEASVAPQVPAPWDDSAAIAVAPMPGGIVDPQPIGWDHITIWPDGHTLTVYFWNGAEACFGLDRVDLADVDGALGVTLFTGFRVDASNKRCTAELRLFFTVVMLEAPILGGGTPGLAGTQPNGRGATPILPGAALAAMEPQPWTLVDVAPDGRTLLISFGGGVEACYGLARVDTLDQDGTTTIVVQYGPIADPGGDPPVCPAVLVSYYTPVLLETPLLLGGVA